MEFVDPGSALRLRELLTEQGGILRALESNHPPKEEETLNQRLLEINQTIRRLQHTSTCGSAA